MFCEAALLSTAILRASVGLTLAMPEPLPAQFDTVELEMLRDLILAVQGKHAEEIVPNSLTLDETREAS